jgi:hypothetical protein
MEHYYSEMEHYYSEIVGWFDFEDIYKKAVEDAQNGDIFLEI